MMKQNLQDLSAQIAELRLIVKTMDKRLEALEESKSNIKFVVPEPQTDYATPDKVVSLYSLWLGFLPQPRKLTDTRKRKIRAAKMTIEEWSELFQCVIDQKFSHTFVTIDWLLSPGNRQKLLEGNYHDRKPQQRQPRTQHDGYMKIMNELQEPEHGVQRPQKQLQTNDDVSDFDAIGGTQLLPESRSPGSGSTE